MSIINFNTATRPLGEYLEGVSKPDEIISVIDTKAVEVYAGPAKDVYDNLKKYYVEKAGYVHNNTVLQIYIKD